MGLFTLAGVLLFIRDAPPPPMTLSQQKSDQLLKIYLLDWAVAERVKHVFRAGCCYRVGLHLF